MLLLFLAEDPRSAEENPSKTSGLVSAERRISAQIRPHRLTSVRKRPARNYLDQRSLIRHLVRTASKSLS
jgi:hypothetical protein